MARLGLFIILVLADNFVWAEEVKQPRVLPGEVVIQRENGPVVMQLTGFANRKLLGRKIYLISSYCENRAAVDNAADVLALKGMKQLRIRMLRNLPSSLIAGMIRRGFEVYDHEQHLVEEIKQIEDHLRRYEFQIGDEIILTSLEATGLSCQINTAEPIVIEKPALVRVVWSVYFEDPPYLAASIPRGLTRLILPRDPACAESGEGTDAVQRTPTRDDGH